MKFYVIITVFLAFVLFANIVLSKTLSRQRRIIDGKVERSYTPFMASIRKGNSRCNADYNRSSLWFIYYWFAKVAYHTHRCGGSIITERHILTAAHCSYEVDGVTQISPEKFSVAVGTLRWDAPNAHIYCVHKIRNHELHSSNSDYIYDISVFVLTKPLYLGDPTKIAIIPLSKTPFDDNSNKILTVYGWGIYTTEHSRPSDYLRSMEVTVTAFEYRPWILSYSPEQTLCVRSELTLTRPGDSGAPLVNQKGEQIGVFLSLLGNSYYARISYYYQWIQDKIATQID